MIVLGAIALCMFLVLGIAVFVLACADLAHHLGQARRDRLRTKATIVQPRRWS